MEAQGPFEADRTPSQRATTCIVKSTPTPRHSPNAHNRVIVAEGTAIACACAANTATVATRSSSKDGANTKNIEKARETRKRLPNNALWRGEQIIKKTPHRLYRATTTKAGSGAGCIAPQLTAQNAKITLVSKVCTHSSSNGWSDEKSYLTLKAWSRQRVCAS